MSSRKGTESFKAVHAAFASACESRLLCGWRSAYTKPDGFPTRLPQISSISALESKQTKRVGGALAVAKGTLSIALGLVLHGRVSRETLGNSFHVPFPEPLLQKITILRKGRGGQRALLGSSGAPWLCQALLGGPVATGQSWLHVQGCPFWHSLTRLLCVPRRARGGCGVPGAPLCRHPLSEGALGPR